MPHAFSERFENVLLWARIYYNLRELRRNTWLPSSELEKMQAKRLKGFLKYAYENVAFYHRTFNEARVKPGDISSVADLCKIPPITKSDVQRNFKSLIARGMTIENCVKDETSGSTGMPLTVVAEKRASQLRKANVLRHYVENGGRLFRDKFVLLGARRLPHKRTTLGSFLKHLGIYRNMKLSIQDPIEDIVDTLTNFKPDVIKANLSFLLLLAKAMEKRGKIILPKIIWSNGELVDDRSRRLINSAFRVEMFDSYGCTEAGSVAWECCEHVGYHINIDMVVTEFVRGEEHVSTGETGEIILTPLWNWAMPLVRYRIGDVGTPSDESCPCGRGLPLMKVIEGRLDDFIVLPSGRIISPIIAPLFVESVEGVAEYRIVQEKKDYFLIQVELKKGYNADMVSQIKAHFAEGLGEKVDVDIEIVDTVITGRKLRRVVSKVLPRERFVSG